MRFTVDHDAGMSFHEQLRSSVREAIDSGALKAGDRLPPVRAISRNTGLA